MPPCRRCGKVQATAELRFGLCWDKAACTARVVGVFVSGRSRRVKKQAA